MFSRCTPKGRKSRAFCICSTATIILAIISVIIVAIVFITGFKIPEVETTGAKAAQNAPNVTPTSISMDWIVDAQIKNFNAYTLEFLSVSTDLYLDGTTYIGNGSKDYILLEPSSSKDQPSITKIEFPANITVSSSDPNSAVVRRLLESCRSGGPKLPIEYRINGWAKIAGMGPFPIPQITRKTDQQCPVKLDSMTKDLLESAINDIF